MSDRYAPKMSDLRVYRPKPTASVEVRRSYGPSLGDDYATTVSRTDDRVRIYQPRSSGSIDWNMSTDEARMIAEAILAVIGWEDDRA